MDAIVQFLDGHAWLWPVFIVLARIVDVSLGTVRTITVVRGHRGLAAALGFAEVLVWVIAVSGVLLEVTMVKLISYALGFAAGNVAGIFIEQKIGLGQQMVMLVSRRQPHSVAFALRMAGFRVTEVAAHGEIDDVALCFTVTARRRVDQVLAIARGADEDVDATIQDVRETSLAYAPAGVPVTGWRAVLKKK